MSPLHAPLLVGRPIAKHQLGGGDHLFATQEEATWNDSQRVCRVSEN